MSATVCKPCGDTHYAPNDGSSRLCTHCPTPCRKCAGDEGRGAYCATTPCTCACHGPRKARPTVLEDVAAELARATRAHGSLHSAHEAYAVLLEEVDELWEEVKKKSSARDHKRMREEAVQIAAMAVRFVMDVLDKEGR